MTTLNPGPTTGTHPDAHPRDADALDRDAAQRPTREELLRSRDELARRVEADRALHEIAGQIAALRDTDELLQDIVEHARRLTGSDGAHLTLRIEGSADLRPYVMAGATDEASRRWLRGIRLEPGTGTNALAAELGEPVVTSDYRVDPRLPHGPGGGTAARRMAMIAIAAVPMHGAHGEVMGTLSISYQEAREFEPPQIEVLQAFADYAAIAVHNARLHEDRRVHAVELAVAQERAHLARELHDSVTQALFSMTLQTSALDLLLGRGDIEGAQARVGALASLQRDALAEMRALIFALRPPSLEQDGLVQALRSSVGALGSRSDLRLTLEADELPRPDAAVEDALYRIAQEALHNVIKHARASWAVVRVRADGDDVCLEVADDGVGFDDTAVPAGHLGVAGMRARAGLIGGRLEIESGAGRGTVVRIRAPRGGRALGGVSAA